MSNLMPKPHSHKNKTQSIRPQGNPLQQSSPPRSLDKLPSINPEEASCQKVYRSIVELNRNYLLDKVNVGNVKKPSKYDHKLPSRTGITEYHRRYGNEKRSVTLPGSAQRVESLGLKMKGSNTQVTNFQSSYRADFTESKTHKPPALDLNEVTLKHIGYASEKVPSFNQSVYNRDYGFKGFTPSDAVKQMQSIVLGGKFQGQSTYERNYRKKEFLKSLPTEPIIQKEHKIFLGVDKQNRSSYQQNFLNRPIEVQKPIKPSNRFQPYIRKVQRKSEYQNQFEGKDFGKQTNFSYMNKDELEKYIMSLK